MTPVVAVIAPGAMGAAVGKRLADRGLRVLTSLAGRSESTATRAREAGMVAASDEEIACADFILSILPPGDALSLAHRFAPALTTSNAKPVYVDCNAINPTTVERVAATIAPTGCRFVDCGIIGSAAKRQGFQSALLRVGRSCATLCYTTPIWARCARAGGIVERGFGAENVLCRDHQRNAGDCGGNDAGSDAGGFRGSVVRRAFLQPEGDVGGSSSSNCQ